MYKYIPQKLYDDFNDHVQDMIKMYNTTTWNEIVKLTHKNITDDVDISRILILCKHPTLTKIIFNTKYPSKKYLHYSHAIRAITDNNFLIFIEEINLFCVFDNINSYLRMIVHIHTIIFNKSDINMTFTHYQIILSNQKQKIGIYVIHESEIKSDIIKICSDFFKNEVVIDRYSEGSIMTVNYEVDNLDIVKREIDKFRFYVNICHSDLNNEVKLTFPYENLYPTKYIIYPINSHGEYNSRGISFDPKRILKGIPIKPEFINIPTKPINILNDRHNEAQTWINNNPPNHGTSTLAYYKQYAKSLNGSTPIKSSIFNDFVTLHNYTNTKVGRCHEWHKNNI